METGDSTRCDPETACIQTYHELPSLSPVSISNDEDESLWLKLNFYGGKVPYKLVEKAAENGCKYLSVAKAFLYPLTALQTFEFEIFGNV
jgi:hypothetical protein